MVARGDLGAELPIEEVPLLQVLKLQICLCWIVVDQIILTSHSSEEGEQLKVCCYRLVTRVTVFHGREK
jgi:hypothetical protein